MSDAIALAGARARAGIWRFKTLARAERTFGNISAPEQAAIYRIIQEQLNNILKYADASSVTIRIAPKANKIFLTISDNGKGFDTRVQRNGIGITNINSRAELYNGKVEIDSSPGNGCRLKVEFQTPGVVSPKAA